MPKVTQLESERAPTVFKVHFLNHYSILPPYICILSLFIAWITIIVVQSTAEADR